MKPALVQLLINQNANLPGRGAHPLLSKSKAQPKPFHYMKQLPSSAACHSKPQILTSTRVSWSWRVTKRNESDPEGKEVCLLLFVDNVIEGSSLLGFTSLQLASGGGGQLRNFEGLRQLCLKT
jgi:hypothetical protein